MMSQVRMTIAGIHSFIPAGPHVCLPLVVTFIPVVLGFLGASATALTHSCVDCVATLAVVRAFTDGWFHAFVHRLGAKKAVHAASRFSGQRVSCLFCSIR